MAITHFKADIKLLFQYLNPTVLKIMNNGNE